MNTGLNSANALNGDFSFSQLDFGSLSSLFSGLNCIGGSAYDDVKLKNNVNLMNEIFSQYVQEINNSVVNDISKLGYHVASFKGFSKMLNGAYIKAKADGWNSCSTNNFDATIRVTDFFMTTGGKSLDSWLEQYFVKGASKSTLTFKNYKSLTTGFQTGDGFWGTSAGGAETVTVNEPEFDYTRKVGAEIKAFELNSYSLDAHKSKYFNPSEFLTTLSTVLVSATSSGSGSGTIDASGQVVYDENNTPKTTNAGMGYLFGGLALTGLAVWGFSKIKDTGKGSATARTIKK